MHMYENTNGKQIYQVVGAQKHVHTSEARIQNNIAFATGNSNSIKWTMQEHCEWKQVPIVTPDMGQGWRNFNKTKETLVSSSARNLRFQGKD